MHGELLICLILDLFLCFSERITVLAAGLFRATDSQQAWCVVRCGWALLDWQQQDTAVWIHFFSWIPISYLISMHDILIQQLTLHLWITLNFWSMQMYMSTYICSRTTKTSKCLNLASFNYLGFAAADEYCTPRVIESLKKYSASTCSSRVDGGTFI